jgi:indole-3-glycerol phosphate synthase
MLEPILDSVRSRLPDLVSETETWLGRAAAAPPARDLGAALTGAGLGVIAEIKRRSPSAGDIAPGLDPAALATAYASGGASAISVLTEEDHFGGSIEDLRTVRAAVDIPLLRKDFVLHPVQVAQARAAGADAVLLIAAVLDDATLGDLVAVTRGFGMTALVEAHDGSEVARSITAGAAVIGVNNRDLTTFDVDLGTAEALRSLIPADAVAVAESGVTSIEGARRMARAGYDAILVGQAAAQAEDPAAFVSELIGAS